MTITAPAPVAEPQWKSALDRGNRVRLARAERMRALRKLTTAEGAAEVRRLVVDPPWDVQTLEIVELLRQIHRVGRERARKLLLHAPVMRENAALIALTPRERHALMAALDRLR